MLRPGTAQPGLEPPHLLRAPAVGADDGAGQVAVVADLHLDGAQAVEAQELHHRLEVRRQRRRHQHDLVALLLVVFFVMDRKNFLKAPADVRQRETAHEEWLFRGLRNLVFLGVVLGAVFLPKSIQETTIAGVVSIPALVMILAAVASYFVSTKEVHEANDFNFGPVKEVGFLFIGIFLTMIPALQILESGELVKISSPLQYYFSTGALSAFLDNAPTYLSFLAAAMGGEHLSVDKMADVHAFTESGAHLLMAISMGAVFFGAGSYIGNGPNFMVKAIAEKAKVHTPSFIGYMVGFSIPILLPILVLVGWLLLR